MEVELASCCFTSHHHLSPWGALRDDSTCCRKRWEAFGFASSRWSIRDNDSVSDRSFTI